MNRFAHKEKICTLCGHDCSNRSRMRDPKGQYYCTVCYEQAQARRHNGVAPAPTPAPRPAARPTAPPRPAGNEPLEFWSEFSAAEEQMLCPGCDAPRLPGAVLCTNCGLDTRTGRRRESLIEESDTPRAEAVPACSKWHDIIGYQEVEAERSYRRELLVAAGMLVGGLLVMLWHIATTVGGVSVLLVSVGYTAVLGIEVLVGVAALWIASRLWLGGAGPLGPALLRLAAIYAVVDALVLFLAPLLAFALVVQALVYLALLAWQFELDFRDAVLIGFLTFALKLGVAFVLIGALIGVA